MPHAKPTLVVGATPNPRRFAFIATNMLLDYEHPVRLFGIKKGNIGGLPIANEWPSDKDIDTITLYINSRWQKAYYDHILHSSAKRVIFNPGTENPELVKLLQERNIQAIEACTLVLLQTNQY